MENPKKESRPTPRQLVGISMPPDQASRFKAEAGRRNLSLRDLFIEMWSDYEAKPEAQKKKS